MSWEQPPSGGVVSVYTPILTPNPYELTESFIKRVLDHNNIKDITVEDVLTAKKYDEERYRYDEYDEVVVLKWIGIIRQAKESLKTREIQEAKMRAERELHKQKELEEWIKFKEEFELKYPNLNIDRIPEHCFYCRWYHDGNDQQEIREELEKDLVLRDKKFHILISSRGAMYGLCNFDRTDIKRGVGKNDYRFDLQHTILIPRPLDSSCYAFEPNFIIQKYRDKILQERKIALEKAKKEESKRKEKLTKKRELKKTIEQAKTELEGLNSE